MAEMSSIEKHTTKIKTEQREENNSAKWGIELKRELQWKNQLSCSLNSSIE